MFAVATPRLTLTPLPCCVATTTTITSTIITSDTRVVRDVFYTGNPIQERCTVITRLAPSFIRFGSFEVAKGPDPETGRPGSSPGNTGLIKTLGSYVLEVLFPEIDQRKDLDSGQKFQELYREVRS